MREVRDRPTDPPTHPRPRKGQVRFLLYDPVMQVAREVAKAAIEAALALGEAEA